MGRRKLTVEEKIARLEAKIEALRNPKVEVDEPELEEDVVAEETEEEVSED